MANCRFKNRRPIFYLMVLSTSFHLISVDLNLRNIRKAMWPKYLSSRIYALSPCTFLRDISNTGCIFLDNLLYVPANKYLPILMSFILFWFLGVFCCCCFVFVFAMRQREHKNNLHITNIKLV